MITFDAGALHEGDLEPFFVGWTKPPTLAQRLAMLQAAHGVVLARENNRLVGFVTAISDGVNWTYIPLLEVHPDYQHKGIGTELMRRIIDRYRDFYGIDLNCDDDLVPFYERLGMARLNGMLIRNRDALG